MSSILSSDLPSEALLGTYTGTGSYTDCYTLEVSRVVEIGDYVSAFYTTPTFKLERWLISRALGVHSTDADAQSLAQASASTFAAWRVEARSPNQLLVAAGRTRSWFMVTPQTGGASTRLFFGSAVVPRSRGGLGWSFSALLGFHKVYSRVLLRAAAQRLESTMRA